MFLSCVACLRAQDSTASKGGAATLYIYRGGQFTNALNNWALFVDGEKVCKLSNNKFIVVKVQPGKRTITSKIGGIDLFKKETAIELETEAGGSYYVACTIKQSFTRSRMEFMEVTKSTAAKQMEGIALDNCQEGIDKKEGK